MRAQYKKNTPPETERRILWVHDLMEYMGIGRDLAYSLMRSESFPSTKLGKAYFVEVSQLEKWLERNAGREIEV